MAQTRDANRVTSARCLVGRTLDATQNIADVNAH
jgi:hypothetical protein